MCVCIYCAQTQTNEPEIQRFERFEQNPSSFAIEIILSLSHSSHFESRQPTFYDPHTSTVGIEENFYFSSIRKEMQLFKNSFLFFNLPTKEKIYS